MLLYFVSQNNNLISHETKIKNNPNHPTPISINVISGAKIDYRYNKKYIKKGFNGNQIYFTLKPTDIKNNTTLKVTQYYKNDFLVPTIEKNNVHIVNDY